MKKEELISRSRSLVLLHCNILIAWPAARQVYVFWKETQRMVTAQFNTCAVLCNVRALRVAFPGMGTLIRWYISSKAKYLLESDSEQVPWGKDAKYFEKRVICACNHCITSTWILLFRWISATYGARGIWRLLPMQLKRQPNTRFGELSERSGWFMSDVNFGFLDRRIFLHSVSGSVWLRMRWSLSWLRCKARVIRGIGTKRFQMTRLETRTKESTHVCEYVPWNGMCVVKVTVIIFVVTTDFNFRREVWV